MDKYKSERQITKEFLNESFLDKMLGRETSQPGIHTTTLKRAGKSAAASVSPVNMDYVETASALLDSTKYKKLKDEMGGERSHAYRDVTEILKLIYNLQRLVKPEELARLYREDTSPSKENFAVNLVNEALERVHIQGNRYMLGSPQKGYQAGEFKIR